MDRRALDVAMAIGPDLRPGAVAPDEGVVVGHRAVGADPHHLADVAGKILRRVEGVAVAQRHEQASVGGEREAAAEVLGPLHLRQLADHHLDVVQPAVAEPAAGDSGGGPALARRGIADIRLEARSGRKEGDGKCRAWWATEY